MIKTKRQLRAEAVERLKNLESSGMSYMPSDVLEKVTPFPNANIATLIDLLTDDEPPETHMALPVDMNGVPVRPRDEMVLANGEVVKVVSVGGYYGDAFFTADSGPFTARCYRHHSSSGEAVETAPNELPEGVMWPRFEDGALVKPGDVVWEDNYGNACAGREREVYEIDFAHLRGPRCWLRDKNGGTIYADNMYEHGPAKRPPLMAADGKPIEVGQVLYGEDGQAWTVDRIDYGQPHSVIAHCGDSERGLKPGWLTHEEPDSAKRIMSDHTREVCAIIEDRGGFIPDEFAIANWSYIDRIEKLAKEGA